MSDTPERLRTIQDWLQREDDALLYFPDEEPSQPETSAPFPVDHGIELPPSETCTGIAGEVIQAGQAVYQDAATGQYHVLRAAIAAQPVMGIALSAARPGDAARIMVSGGVTLGTVGSEPWVPGREEAQE